MQLWLIGNDDARLEAIVVTEINVYPRRTACNFVLVAGTKREAWIDHVNDIASWANDQGCDLVEVFGRIGWQKEPALKDWTRIGVILQKELGRGALKAA